MILIGNLLSHGNSIKIKADITAVFVAENLTCDQASFFSPSSRRENKITPDRGLLKTET